MVIAWKLLSYFEDYYSQEKKITEDKLRCAMLILGLYHTLIIDYIYFRTENIL